MLVSLREVVGHWWAAAGGGIISHMTHELEQDLELSAVADFALDLADLGALVQFVEGFCHDGGIDRELALKLVLVVEELATNALRHGRSGDAPLGVRLQLSRHGGLLELRYEDDGPPFDPLREAPLAATEGDALARPVGGLGVHLVRSLTDAQRYSYRDGRNCLVLEKRL